jgi:hypothetical protein
MYIEIGVLKKENVLLNNDNFPCRQGKLKECVALTDRVGYSMQCFEFYKMGQSTNVS